MFPVVGIQIVIGNFFQSIGKAKISVFLSLTRQLLYLLPGLIIFPHHFGLDGIWMSMPVSDLLAVITAVVILWFYIRKIINTTHGQNVIKENTGQVIEANQAQLSLKDTVYIVKQDTVWLEREKANQVYESEVQPNSYDKRIHRYRKRWESLIPTHIKLQYAGNMGFLSMGMSY